MGAFLFTGWASVFDPTRGLSDSCSTGILRDCEEPQARAWFEGWLQHGGRAEGEHPRKIEKIVVSPIMDRLFTETGDEPLNWAALADQAARVLEVEGEAYEQQGYWADCDALVSPARLAWDMNALQRSLPEDVRSGLNWSADTQNLFLVSALVIPSFEAEAETDYDNPQPSAADESEESSRHQREAPFPELAAREATAVVKARNTVVAAWLWRRHAAQTPLARNPIRVDGWCSVVGPQNDAA
jgi:hypothetical protein